MPRPDRTLRPPGFALVPGSRPAGDRSGRQVHIGWYRVGNTEGPATSLAQPLLRALGVGFYSLGSPAPGTKGPARAGPRL
jgi:hypothetical protein